MYKVFVNDTPIIFSTEKKIKGKHISIPLKMVKLKKLIKKIHNGKQLYVNLYHKNENKLLKHLKKKLPVVTAAGGMVFNEKNEILFIHRNGKWDLPKGKMEKKENIEETALREVEEETGVKNLEIVKPIQITYHIFKRSGKYKLKETHWFEMKTNYTGNLVPEESENITKAKWKDLNKSKKALDNCYANIKLLFPGNYLAENPKEKIAKSF